MTKTQAPTVKKLVLPDNAVEVTAQHLLGTTVVLVGVRPQRPSPEAKVTSVFTNV